ncbi:energy-coupling factor ABC transporter ATP-binding protein [Massilia sp. Dwa41.01b]|uniref:energy-coupling factor ABC transporter ATP-binding protein n=1 Tax=unclassified Massilia TaxID=2609279 RepID=UPI0015FEC6E3|nr:MULTISPECIES: energy-coupling factor ABC transporter ATP-binding protein [unclassified Massilia]QNA90308.1 energy-coupling factor ABC transporter ATP-binding protein [Massilia sp. Dwa41.01b]QNB01208.1 energy-coupling factor ABC transporter ATP-binding protein [Massilia sp. Se16.2.3]
MSLHGAPLLDLRGLRKRHGARILFDIDALRLDAASAYVLTGANGVGKSTLLRVLAGLESAQVDSVAFDGAAVTLQPYPGALRRAIVYVHQHPIMFSTSVAHNIAYGLLARGESKARVAQAVEEAMAWAGVAHLRATDPARLSGGEKQRVALARASVLEPRLLLLDEPTANLDGPAREQVIALIPTLLQKGSTVVMACHDRDLIGLPGVRRLKLRDGRLEYRPFHKGEPDETP